MLPRDAFGAAETVKAHVIPTACVNNNNNNNNKNNNNKEEDF